MSYSSYDRDSKSYVMLEIPEEFQQYNAANIKRMFMERLLNYIKGYNAMIRIDENNYNKPDVQLAFPPGTTVKEFSFIDTLMDKLQSDRVPLDMILCKNESELRRVKADMVCGVAMLFHPKATNVDEQYELIENQLNTIVTNVGKSMIQNIENTKAGRLVTFKYYKFRVSHCDVGRTPSEIWTQFTFNYYASTT